jgi:hypothetical protein
MIVFQIKSQVTGFAALVLCFVAALAFTQSAPGTSGAPPWKRQVCGGRRTCRIVKLTPAGRSPAGAALKVAEVRFGLADKLEDAPEDGCKIEGGENDGGVEYWLIEGDKQRRLLSLCNEGYGGGGGGEDEIEISNNRFTHNQNGGSTDAWVESETIQLSPQRIISFSSSALRKSDPDLNVFESQTDVATMITRVTFGDLHAFALPTPGLGITEGIPLGAPLGSCAMRMGPENLADFLTFGKLDPQRKPEVRLLALSQSELLIQIYDPKPAARGASWVKSDHIEIWTSKYDEKYSGLTGEYVERYHRLGPDPNKVMQVGITLDGSVYPGIGQPVLPKVAVATVKDESGRKATLLDVQWPAEAKDAFENGVAVVYSQADNDRQLRLFSTTPIERNRPTYLPGIIEMPVGCGVRNGRRNVNSYSSDLSQFTIAGYHRFGRWIRK